MSYHHLGAVQVTPIPGARRSLGASPYTPREQQIPFTNRGDVRYAIGNYGIFDPSGTVDGNMQSLGGVLAVM